MLKSIMEVADKSIANDATVCSAGNLFDLEQKISDLHILLWGFVDIKMFLHILDLGNMSKRS